MRLARFGDPDEGDPGGWVILDEPELHLGADIVVPDLAGWRREPERAPRRQQPHDAAAHRESVTPSV
jgi:hypothetical protein